MLRHDPKARQETVARLAAGVGFLASALMLWMRLQYMPVRYALAGVNRRD